MILKKGGGFTGGTVAGATTFSDNVLISGTLEVTGAVTFTTTVTGSGNIMAGAAFALGFTGRGQFKSSSDGLLEPYATDGSTRGGLTGKDGAATAVTYGLGGAVNVGIYGGSSTIRFSAAGLVARLDANNFRLTSGLGLVWGNGNADVSPDCGLERAAAGIVKFTDGSDAGTGAGGCQPAQSASGSNVRILTAEENLVLNTGATITDTTADLLPANSVILAVMTRTTTAITTAVNFDVGDPTTATRFATNYTGVALDSVAVHTTAITTGIANATTGIFQAAAAKIRITTDANPGAGRVKITVVYMLCTPATS